MRWFSTGRTLKRVLANKLGTATSPYLVSHKNNPVAWQTWSKETVELARKLNRPLFLSIGYNSCHWCHVMNNESFSNESVAEKLNSNFVNVKIDKDEWPDVDRVYMTYLQMTRGQAGWPLNVFVTPQGLHPIFGGTYWAGPGVGKSTLARLNAVPFVEIIDAVASEWSKDSQKCIDTAKKQSEKVALLVDSKSLEEPTQLEPKSIAKMLDLELLESYDDKNGGFGGSPKFVMPFILRMIFENPEHFSPTLLNAANTTVEKVWFGGIKDQIGHGLARYSVTSDWHLPHFEKMLVDQSLMLHACLSGRNNMYAEKFAHDLCDELVSGPLLAPNGGWYSGLNADSYNPDGERSTEGEFYVWTYEDFHSALKDRPKFDEHVMAFYYGVEYHGNVNTDSDSLGDFTYKNVLSRYKSLAEVGAAFGKSIPEIKRIIFESKIDLAKWRAQNKPAPSVDSKIITGWNGLSIGALARASYQLDRPDALEQSLRAFDLLKTNNWRNGELSRTSQGAPAAVDDYAYTIEGLLYLYKATLEPRHLEWAIELQAVQDKLFGDSRGGYFDSRNWSWLIFRHKTAFDAAEPSPNGVSLANLRRLAFLTGSDEYLQKARRLCDCYSQDLSHQPQAYSSMVSAMLKPKPALYAIVGEGSDPKVLQAAREKQRSESASLICLDKDSVHLFPQFAERLHEAEGKGQSLVQLAERSE